jgi:hypothetical protein
VASPSAAGDVTSTLFGLLGRSDEAIEAYQRLIDDYAQDPAPALHEQGRRGA